MLTRCPSCGAWFRVRAEHLSVANGLVTCGACDYVFNALASLVEEAAAPTAPAPLAASPALTGTAAPADEAPPAVAPTPAAPVITALTEPVAAPIAPAPLAASPALTGTAAPADEAPPAVAPTPAAPAITALTEPVAAPTAPAPLAASPAVTDTAAPAEETPPAVAPTPAAPATTALTEPVAAPIAPAPLAASPAVTDTAAPADEASPAVAPTPPPAPTATAPVEAPAAPVAAASLPVSPAGTEAPAVTTAPPTAAPTAAAGGGSAATAHGPAPGDDDEPVATPARTSTLSAAEHAILFTAPGSGEDDLDEASDLVAGGARDARADERTAAPLAAAVPVAADDAAVPDLLRAEVAALARAHRPRGPRGRWLWATAVGVLALVLAAQGAFLARATIVAALPASAPWFARACARIGCPEQASAAAASSVELAARDVREHPQYRDALLVNATLVNQAAAATPYPVLELTLHDGTGRAVGSRRFAPAEYLDHSIDIASGMAPGQPVFVVLELGGEAARASSFEFSFL